MLTDQTTELVARLRERLVGHGATDSVLIKVRDLSTLLDAIDQHAQAVAERDEARAETELSRALLAGDANLYRSLWIRSKEDGRIAIDAHGVFPMFIALATEARQMLGDKEASNFLELRFADDAGEMSLLIQKADGETPAQQCGRLKKELARLEADNRRLLDTLRTIRDWDCLNPPNPKLCADHPWLKRLVDAALEGNDDE